MKSDRLTLVWKASGYLDAQLIKNYLESFGIQVYTFEESVGAAYGLTTTPLGEVEIYVPNENAQEAEMCLESYLNDKLDD
ncbi:MAG: hypothetical protein MUO42_12765 [Anaerolineaceae bacterium]|nr:hypothetical protein [Anaerolineaceae bacterium]